MATVERRNQGGAVRYRVRWWADGKQRSKTFQREAEAKRFKASLEGDVANGSYVDPREGQVTVATFAAGWFHNIVHLRPSTLSRLEVTVFKHVVPEFGRLPLTAVTTEHVSLWVRNSRVGASATRKNLFALRALLDAAVAQNKVRTNVTKSVRVPAEPRHEQRFLNQDEVTRLAAAVGSRYRCMVLVGAYGGLRFGEVVGLRRKNINMLRNTVSVTDTLVDTHKTWHLGPPKTKASRRTVTLPASVMRELDEHLRTVVASDDDSFVFTNGSGDVIRRSWFRHRVWLKACTLADLDGVRFHDLRHTFVSLWVSLGRNAKEVSKAAGHASVAFTLDRYGHLYEVDDADLASRLDRLLGA